MKRATLRHLYEYLIRSKMPVKKKSGFQITSVTTAQVAANSITEDTESLEDPDESRTEDISSEIFDVSSRATDHEHAEVCDRSSSDETLNNVGEADTPGALSPNIPHDREGFGGRLPGRGQEVEVEVQLLRSPGMHREPRCPLPHRSAAPQPEGWLCNRRWPVPRVSGSSSWTMARASLFAEAGGPAPSFTTEIRTARC